MKDKNETIEKINGLISDIKVAMLTTVDQDGDFHSRPMMTQQNEFDGDVWFFANRSSDKVKEIQQNPSVNVSYSQDGNFVSLAGQASIISDVNKKKELWYDGLQAWFEGGPESDEVILIYVDAKSAQYWDTPSGTIGQAYNIVKVMITGDKDDAGDSDKVQY